MVRIRSLVVTVLLTAVASSAVPVQAQQQTRIVFASGPDGSGTVAGMIEAFNEAHAGAIEVVWRQMPDESDAHREALLSGLEPGPDGVDVMATDVVWTAEFARRNLVEDLTDRFYEAYDREVFLPAPLRSATWRLRIWGVPWYTDAGLLFYRRDLLSASGFDAPPATWDELASMARQVMTDSDTPHGFVFQGAAYEGGTANAAEFIWSAGGDILTPRLTVTGLVVNTATEIDEVAIETEEAARGFDIARGFVADGVSPTEVANFREADALAAFMTGDAVFLRNWPYAYAALMEAGFTSDQIGVAPLPAAGPDGERASALGGWNLMINAASSVTERDAAWTLIRYLADIAQQREHALGAGVLPSVEALYGDPAIQSANPVVGVGLRVFESLLHERPMSPLYSEISALVATTFNRVLRGEITGREATELLEPDLRAISIRNR